MMIATDFVVRLSVPDISHDEDDRDFHIRNSHDNIHICLVRSTDNLPWDQHLCMGCQVPS